jgi:hypothetical protein
MKKEPEISFGIPGSFFGPPGQYSMVQGISVGNRKKRMPRIRVELHISGQSAS